ncbi:hypothetical protein PP175_21230 [Aneurinibacillus sp. Ricciae_BoGa-3]|uniref:hypothetical protein n=1 Tax=Aneurinibacillus sp. Ricciae_BoGa-3 TaxID=3022697 RepID=UPI00234153D2|nr:hypothetical protein [Aneurinibacillus sp. Ricciae_BoGa-3]WCK53815.1 hypothetical protein PP175_21230 [Aneurinibacillus sp. Ricciae_BoGa-3]
MAVMKNKPVSFNLENEEDRRLHEYAIRIKNFSGYIKQLMKEEMKKEKSEVIRTPGGGIKITRNG